MALKEKGIAAEFLSSTQTSNVRNKVSFGVCSCPLLVLMKVCTLVMGSCAVLGLGIVICQVLALRCL